MNAVLDFWAHPVMDTIGLALLHFLWQAGLVGLAVLFALYLIPRANAPLRYNVCVGAMLLLLLLPLGTAVQMHLSHSPEAIAPAAQPNIELYQVQGQSASEETAGTEEPPVPVEASTAEAAPVVAPSVPAQVSNDVFRWRHALALLWLVGLVFSSLRMLDGLITLWRLKRNAHQIADPALLQLFETVKGQLDIKQHIAFKSTHQVLQPLLVGWLKPMVILPAGMITGMAPAHIEAVLAHELIHVRRHDYLVLWLQSLLETLFFFHPVVWWVSNQLRIEREYCTDAEAVAAMADKLTYVQALAVLEEQKAVWRMSLSMKDGRLVDRIRRLTGASHQSRTWQGSWSTLIAVMIGCIALFLACEAAYVDESKPAEELFQEANELARDGQYGRAVRVAEVAADKGNLCAHTLLIDLYRPRKGYKSVAKGVKLPPVWWSGESEKMAEYWANQYGRVLEQEAMNGNQDAMLFMWSLFGEGRPGEYSRYIADNDSLALYWLKQAADLGHDRANFIYGMVVLPKETTKEERISFFRESALAGNDWAYHMWAGLVSKYDDPRPYFNVARIAIDNESKGVHRWIGKTLEGMEKLIKKGNEGTREWMMIADSLELRERLAKIPREPEPDSLYRPTPFCPETKYWRYPE